MSLLQSERELYANQAATLNTELSIAVDESIKTATPMHVEVIRFIQDWKQRWASWCDNSLETVSKFDRQFTHPVRVGYTTETIDAEAALSLNTSWVANYGAVPEKLPPVSDLFDECFRGIVSHQKRMDVTQTLKEFVAKAFPLGSFDTVDAAFEVHDLQHADPLALLKAEFSRTIQSIAHLEAQLHLTGEEREACARAEDVKGAEDKTLQAHEIMKKIIEVAYSRQKDSLATNADLAQFGDNVQESVSQASDKIGKATKQNADIKLSASNDLSALQTFMDNFSSQSQQKLDSYQALTNRFKSEMQENTKQQLAIWDVVLQQLQSLTALCTHREELIHARMQETAQEKLRLQHLAEVTEASEKRKHELDMIVLNATRALDFLQAAQTYVQKADDMIARTQHPAKLRKIQIEESLRSYDIYKRFALAGNGMLYKREQRLENVRRLIRGNEFQIMNALETLDTDLPLYRSQLATLNATEVQLSNQATSLADELRNEQERWLAIESFLDECKVDIDPPALLVQELKRDMMKFHVDAVDELTNKEQKLLDGEKANVRKMLNAVEAAKEAFRDRRATSPNRSQQ